MGEDGEGRKKGRCGVTRMCVEWWRLGSRFEPIKKASVVNRVTWPECERDMLCLIQHVLLASDVLLVHMSSPLLDCILLHVFFFSIPLPKEDKHRTKWKLDVM